MGQFSQICIGVLPQQVGTILSHLLMDLSASHGPHVGGSFLLVLVHFQQTQQLVGRWRINTDDL